MPAACKATMIEAIAPPCNSTAQHSTAQSSAKLLLRGSDFRSQADKTHASAESVWQPGGAKAANTH
jgi:hypothetical protein